MHAFFWGEKELESSFQSFLFFVGGPDSPFSSSSSPSPSPSSPSPSPSSSSLSPSSPSFSSSSLSSSSSSTSGSSLYVSDLVTISTLYFFLFCSPMQLLWRWQCCFVKCPFVTIFISEALHSIQHCINEMLVSK